MPPFSSPFLHYTFSLRFTLSPFLLIAAFDAAADFHLIIFDGRYFFTPDAAILAFISDYAIFRRHRHAIGFRRCHCFHFAADISPFRRRLSAATPGFRAAFYNIASWFRVFAIDSLIPPHYYACLRDLAFIFIFTISLSFSAHFARPFAVSSSSMIDAAFTFLQPFAFSRRYFRRGWLSFIRRCRFAFSLPLSIRPRFRFADYFAIIFFER